MTASHGPRPPRPLRAGAGARWDPENRLLSVEPLDHEQPPDTATHITYQGKVWLTFDAYDQVMAVDLPGAPLPLTRGLPQQQRHRYPWSTLSTTSMAQWHADPDSGWVWTLLRPGLPYRRLIAAAAVAIRLCADQSLYLHASLSQDTADT
ncbi:hypothetical protein [Streptomyces resistomycificus]|uniref:Uncharacterized protein n=1 Tax=Streptomyces resistomycificus TaxID=67356 RepID=A0A0L8LG19_9ACTN|nr:hypothetical protein [Streptomyces resistomycificus]KOG37059.1 hypothetical protein ADK37_11555 [Streptomyces resistomycificus]KUN95006.1 hypothetical protein AQJ84_23275 [Streptomyces resistomycificus]